MVGELAVRGKDVDVRDSEWRLGRQDDDKQFNCLGFIPGIKEAWHSNYSRVRTRLETPTTWVGMGRERGRESLGKGGCD